MEFGQGFKPQDTTRTSYSLLLTRRTSLGIGKQTSVDASIDRIVWCLTFRIEISFQ